MTGKSNQIELAAAMRSTREQTVAGTRRVPSAGYGTRRVPTTLELAPAVRSKLAALRRRIRQYVWLHGFTWAVAWLGIAFWTSLALDWFFEPPLPVRGVILGIAGLGLAWVLFRLILCRAFVRLTSSNMAMLLERCFPQFNDSLLCAVELTARGGDLGPYRRQMLAQTCRQAAEPIGEVRLGKVFNPAPLRRSTSAAVLLAASVWAFSTLAPEAFGTWTQRSLLLQDKSWPRKTRLLVKGFEDGTAKVARGDDLEVIAMADLTMPLVPKVVEVRYRTESGARLRATMSREGTVDPAKDDYQEYSYTFRGVLAPIQFDLVGGDDAVRDLRIEVVDRPIIVEMVLDCRFPDYMDRPPRSLPVTGVMQLPLGTRITIRAVANKDLVRVQIDDGHRITLVEPESAGSRRSFGYRLPDFAEDQTLLFTLFDADGIKSRRPVRLALRAVADEPPQLSVELRGIGPAITPQAQLPVIGRITDDYAVAGAWFDYTIDQGEPRTQPIKSSPDNVTEVELEAALEVRTMQLTPGQKLLVCVKAADRFDLAEHPNVGTSQRWLLDVVTPEQLRTMLEARELVLRQRFERIVEEVTETRDSLLRMELHVAAGESIRDEETDEKGGAQTDKEHKAGNEPREPSQKSDQQEELSAQRVSALRTLRVQRARQNSSKNAHETLAVAEAFRGIREELVNNRIDTAELKARLQDGIADPLRRIAEAMFPELERRLHRLEATLADDRPGEENRRLAVAQIDAILGAMQDVLGRMLELEDFHKAVELLREIIHAQQRLSDKTREQHKQKLRELLED